MRFGGSDWGTGVQLAGWGFRLGGGGSDWGTGVQIGAGKGSDWGVGVQFGFVRFAVTWKVRVTLLLSRP